MWHLREGIRRRRRRPPDAIYILIRKVPEVPSFYGKRGGSLNGAAGREGRRVATNRHLLVVANFERRRRRRCDLPSPTYKCMGGQSMYVASIIEAAPA